MAKTCIIFPHISMVEAQQIATLKLTPALPAYINKIRQKYIREQVSIITASFDRRLDAHAPCVYMLVDIKNQQDFVRRFHRVMTAVRYIWMHKLSGNITYERTIPYAFPVSLKQNLGDDWFYYDCLVGWQQRLAVHIHKKNFHKTQFLNIVSHSPTRVSFFGEDEKMLKLCLKQTTRRRNVTRTRLLNSMEWYAKSFSQIHGQDDRQKFLCLVCAFNQLLYPKDHNKSKLQTQLKKLLGNVRGLSRWFHDFWLTRNQILNGDDISMTPRKKVSNQDKNRMRSLYYSSQEGLDEYLPHLYQAREVFKACIEMILYPKNPFIHRWKADNLEKALTDDNLRLKAILDKLNKKNSISEVKEERIIDDINALNNMSTISDFTQIIAVGQYLSNILIQNVKASRLKPAQKAIDVLIAINLNLDINKATDVFLAMTSNFGKVTTRASSSGVIKIEDLNIDLFISACEHFFEFAWRQALLQRHK